MIWVKRGSSGREVVDVQTRLLRLGYELGLAGVDGVFGPETERAVRLFQKKRGREADGVVGPDTWREMVDASYSLGDRQLYLTEPPLRGDDVRELQATLNNVGFNAGRVSGIFSEQTDKAVREFQKNTGLDTDGIVGETSIRALDNFRMRVSSGEITGVWDREALRRPAALKERRVAIDSGDDEFSNRAARALANALVEHNARPILLEERIKTAEMRERALIANEAEAELLVRFQAGAAEGIITRGSVCEYFDNGEFFSSRSRELASLIQNEVAAALKVFDNGVAGKNLTILQATRMPAVIIKPLVSGHPKDDEMAANPDSPAAVAQAVVTALDRYWLEVV